MNILTKTYTLDSNYNFLLLVSIAIVSVSMNSFLQNYRQDITTLIPVVKESPKAISITLTKAHITQEKKKVLPKIKAKKKTEAKKVSKHKPTVKTKKIISKKISQVAVNEIQKIELSPVKEISIEKSKITPKQIQTPIFDTTKKDEFITGLYQLLNENKHYPKMAKRRHLEGIAQIRFKLLKNGNLIHAKLYKSCGYSILDKAALKLVSNIKHYKPIPDVVSMVALNLNIPIKYSR